MNKFLLKNALFFCIMATILFSSQKYFGTITIHSDSTITHENFDSFVKSYNYVDFTNENYQEFTGKILQIPAQQGFMFPFISLDNISPTTKKDSIFLNPQFSLSWGEKVIVDTLYFHNLEKTSPKLLQPDLKYLTGKPYKQNLDSRIKQSLQKYDFLLFHNSKIVKTKSGGYGLNLNLEEKQANKFSGVAGYVPKTSGKDGYFTGQIDIALKNIGGMGRGANIYWSKVNENSQELRLNYFEPHLLRSQIFSNVGFTQTLRDTLVVIRGFNIGFGRNIENAGILELTGDYESTLPTPSGRKLLNLNNTKILKVGFRYQLDNRDLSSNPSKGFYVNTHNRLGFHERNNKQKIMTQTEIYGEYNYPLSKQLVLHINANYQGKFIKNDQLDFSNQIWLGGANSLRGYAENFFSGSEIGIVGGELRWITGYYSRIYIFFDQGYYKNLNNNNNWPFSFGLGLRLESRMGTIGLDYAFGEEDTFTTAKIHVHLENRF